MGGWRKYLELQLQARTGLSSGIFIFALLAIVSGPIGMTFGLVALFVWLADRFNALVAALVLTIFFLLVAALALAACLISRHRTIAQAQVALATRQPAWLDPRLLGGAIQASRALGWRRFAPLLALAVLVVAGVQFAARGRSEDAAENAAEDAAEDEQEEPQPFARAA